MHQSQLLFYTYMFLSSSYLLCMELGSPYGSDVEKDELIEFMMQEVPAREYGLSSILLPGNVSEYGLYQPHPGHLQEIELPEELRSISPPIVLKKKPSSGPLLDDAEVTAGFQTPPLSRFKQQLMYHARLLVNKNTGRIVSDEMLFPKQVEQLNYVASKLLLIVQKKSASSKPSSWLLTSEDEHYVAYPLHNAINYAMNTWGETSLNSGVDKEMHEQENRLLSCALPLPTAQDHVLKCMGILIDAGANPDAQDHLGRRPVQLLASLPVEEPTREEEALKVRQHKKAKEAFQQLALARLCFRGAHVDAPNKQGDTALTRAAELGDIEFVRFLLDAHANPNIHTENEDGKQLQLEDFKLKYEIKEMQFQIDALESELDLAFSDDTIAKIKEAMAKLEETERRHHIVQNRRMYACGTSPLWAAVSRVTSGNPPRRSKVSSASEAVEQNQRIGVAFLLLEKGAKIKASELDAAQLMHDSTGDLVLKMMLAKAISSRA